GVRAGGDPLVGRGDDVRGIGAVVVGACKRVDGEDVGAHAASASTIRRWPACTVRPGWQPISATIPALGATTSISIFIDSSTTTTCPAATRSPGSTSTFQTLPGTGEVTAAWPSASCGSSSVGGGTSSSAT